MAKQFRYVADSKPRIKMVNGRWTVNCVRLNPCVQWPLDEQYRVYTWNESAHTFIMILNYRLEH
jgi:hypothetical protein